MKKEQSTLFWHQDADAEKLYSLFNTLNIARNEQTEEFYQDIIDGQYDLTWLYEVFSELHQAEISYQDHQDLYDIIINNHKREILESIVRYKNLIIELNQHTKDLYKKLLVFINQKKGISNYSRGVFVSRLFSIYETLSLEANYITEKYLYEIVIDHWNAIIIGNISYPTERLERCKMLYREEFDYNESTKNLYDLIIRCQSNTEECINAFKIIRDAGIIFLDENLYIYETITQHFYSAEKIAEAFSKLYKLGLTHHQHHAIYEEVKLSPKFADTILLAFNTLRAADIFYEDPASAALYEAIIKFSAYTDEVVQAFIALKTAGITYQDPTLAELYTALIESPAHATTLARAFITLKTAGIIYKDPNTASLYAAIMASPREAHRLAQAFVILQTAKISFSAEDNHQYFFMAQELYEEIISAFTLLIEAGYNFENHPNVFHFFLEKLKNFRALSYEDIKLLKKFQQYSEQTCMSSCEMEEMDIQAIFKNHFVSSLSEGPLNKKQATCHLEDLLEHIAHVDFNQINMSFDKFSGYVIELPGTPKIFLTSLLRNANLSHLTLNHALLSALGEIISTLSSEGGNDKRETDELGFIDLPDASRLAISYYFTEKYKNINLLLRGEELKLDERYEWLTPAMGSKNLLINFLCGIIANDAMNKLLWLKWDYNILFKLKEKGVLNNFDIEEIQALCKNIEIYQQKLNEAKEDNLITQKEYDTFLTEFEHLQTLFPFYYMLVRKENPNEDLAKQRQTHCQYSTGLTSFSIFKNGSHYFTSREVTTTIAQSIHYPVINSDEGEVIIPGGEQILYTQNQQGTFFSSLVRSPLYQREEHDTSEQAIIHAFQQHLCSPYAEKGHTVLINNLNIERPNHGLAHTYRVMEYIAPVIRYFSQHAKEEGFKTFCQMISQQDIECLRVAAAFSVTGRENEISAVENPQQYDQFRENSANHFAEFITHNQLQEFTDNAMCQRIYNIIRYMGNPAYESLNNCFDEHEQLYRNYLHRILNVAHKLDLPRCYNSAEFTERAVKYCINLSEESDEQHADFIELVRYSTDLIKAHGNNLEMDINFQGKFIDCAIRYQPSFDVVSSSLHRLHAITDSVPKPIQPLISYVL